jgi:undecaprenyl-diphosphatase
MYTISMNWELRTTSKIQKIGASTIDFWWIVARFGLYLYGAIVFGVAYLITNKERLLIVAVPVAVTLLLTLILQRLVRRSRPKATKTTYDLWMHTYSFPSGHSSISFAFATSLSILFLSSSLEYSWIYALAFFIVAICIALSRIVVGVHYAGDVLIGSLIGILVSVTLL